VGGGAWPFLVGGVICLVNSDNERDSVLLTSSVVLHFFLKSHGVRVVGGLCLSAPLSLSFSLFLGSRGRVGGVGVGGGGGGVQF